MPLLAGVWYVNSGSALPQPITSIEPSRPRGLSARVIHVLRADIVSRGRSTPEPAFRRSTSPCPPRPALALRPWHQRCSCIDNMKTALVLLITSAVGLAPALAEAAKKAQPTTGKLGTGRIRPNETLPPPSRGPNS